MTAARETSTLDRHLGFFLNFPFGYVAQGVNWHEGAGIPVAAFDDFGRGNPYPMVRVQARVTTGTVLSTVDTVLPISGEASCTNCHSDPTDVQDSRTSDPTDALLTAGLPVATSLDDPDTTMPARVSVEYVSDINVLRLRDLKHGANYVKTTCNAEGIDCLADATKKDTCTIGATRPNGTASCLTKKALVQKKPVVCQVCHYTPAPIQDAATGAIANQPTRLAALENSCYQCHPGKNTQCQRGPMFNGGMLCSDCHGSMAQFGNDFSRNVSPRTPGAFQPGKDFYTNALCPPTSGSPAIGARVLQWLRQPGRRQPQAMPGEHRPRRCDVRGLPWGDPCGVAERQSQRQR